MVVVVAVVAVALVGGRMVAIGVNSLDKFWTGCRTLENKLFTESVMLLRMALPSYGCAQ